MSSLHRYPDEAAWLAARAAGEYPIGATTAAAMLGLSKYATLWDVWARHHAPHLVEPVEVTDPMRLGTAAEPHILAWAVTGAEHHAHDVVVHDDHPWLRYSPDGRIDLGDGSYLPVEVKTTTKGETLPSGTVIRLTDEDVRRRDFAAQLAIQMAVEEVDRGHLLVASLHPTSRDMLVAAMDAGAPPDVLGALIRSGCELRRYEVHLTADERARLISVLARLRQRHLIDGVEPTQGRPYSVPRGTERGDLVEADERTGAALAAWMDAKAAAKAAKTAADTATETLAALLDSVPGAVLPDVGGARWQVNRGKRTIPVADVETAAPDLYAALVERGLLNTGRPSRHLREVTP